MTHYCVKTGLLILLASAAWAQELPKHFLGAGMGVRGAAPQQISGWSTICNEMLDRTYGCVTTDYTGATTATQASTMVRVVSWRIVHLLGNAGAGAATGVDSVGGSFSAGGVVAVDVSKVLKIPGLFVVVSAKWLKNNTRTTGLPVDVTALNFGIGRGW